MTTWHVLVLLLSVEVFWWGATLNNHSRAMKEISETIERRQCGANQWIRVFMASVMATALSFGVALWWLAALITGAAEKFVYPQWVACGIQLSHIHFFAIIARCTGLQVDNWPFLSKVISEILCKLGLFGDEQ